MKHICTQTFFSLSTDFQREIKSIVEYVYLILSSSKKYRLLGMIVLVIALASCNSSPKEKVEIEYKNYIHGLASPIQLQIGSTTVNLHDYFEKTSLISEILFEGQQLKADSAGNILIPQLQGKTIANLHIEYDKVAHDIPVFATEKIRYRFTYKPTSPKITSVKMSGNMNGWNKDASVLIREGELWAIDFDLVPGLYEYRIWEDEKEMLDPNHNNRKDNGLGGQNSVFTAGNPQLHAPVIWTDAATENSLTFGSADSLEQYQAYFQNMEIAVVRSGTTWKIEIPMVAKALDRSYIRVFASGNRQRSNDLLIPLSHGDVVMLPAALNRKDMQAAVMYFLMVDRFADGNKSNNRPTINDSILPKANNLGGDLQGVVSKIKEGYFNDLGVNTLWISPISRNAEGAWGLWNKGVTTKFSAYHGYWPTAMRAIDDRFGDEASMKELIQLAHDKQMNVILDYVAHHVHQDHPLHRLHPDWSTDLYLPDGSLNTEKWDSHRLTTWFDTFLPTWDFSKPEVVDALTDTAMYWVDHYQLDGFRHDATKHIPTAFWQELTKKIKKRELEQDRHIFQIGETYGNPELIGSYIGSGQLDSQFDFNLYDAAVDAFAKDNTSFANLKRVLMQSTKAYGNHHLMGNISGNQDRARFTSYADGSVQFDEDAKKAGWIRDIENKGIDGFKKIEMLHAFNLTIPGIPCIYYGDEIAMPGANDPDNRRMMHFGDWNQEQQQLHKHVADLVKFRNEHLALSYGDLMILSDNNEVLCFARKYFGKIVVVAFSKKANQPFAIQNAGLDLRGLKSINGILRVEEGKTEVEVNEKGYAIFYN
jgi:glycosidase